MRTRIKINTKELTRAAASLSRLSGESKADLANQNAKFIAVGAFRDTDKTTAGAIREELSATRGKHTKAELILAARARRTGNWPTGKNAIKKEAIKFISRKARTASWLRVGFLPAIRAFGGRAAALKRFSNFPGDATRAKRSFKRPLAVIQHFDRGFIERHPNLLQRVVDKQARFMDRLAYKKANEIIRRSSQ